MGKITKKEILSATIETVAKNSGEYEAWRVQIQQRDFKKQTIERRMEYVMAAVQMGITVGTAIGLCNISKQEFSDWILIDDNKERLSSGLAFAEGKLEFIVHQAATVDPYFALDVLSRRNAKRWDTTATMNFDKGVKAGVKMSQLMGIKPVKMLVKEEDDGFDVTND